MAQSLGCQQSVFKTCFVARVSALPELKSYIACRYDPAGWKSPPAENLLSFCFPLGLENVKPREYMRPEEFSFTLTAGDGSRLHGFCRRTLPPHKAPAKPLAGTAARTAMLRYPQVLCIVSPHPWFPFFYKVLELVEKMLRQEDVGSSGADGTSQPWPATSPAAMFLGELLQRLPPAPALGQLVRVRLPSTELPLDFSPPRRALRGAATSPLLHADLEAVELEVPPDLGLGPENAGIAAARLLFFLPPRVALTLVASLLMERRIILVASAEDKVSAAVHAAAALIHPFRWQHIYLPLLPMSLKDYLAAPMPYLVGLNSDCLPQLRGMPLEEVLLVDLDLGECTPPPDAPGDDAFLLPYAPKLLAALETCKDGTLSSTEFNSTPFIASVMQEYFLKLVGRYRLYITPDTGPPPSPAGQGGMPRAASAKSVGGSSSGGGKDADDVLRAHGYAFDQAAFVAQHRSAAVRQFLQHFRNSQMFEVFITERLLAASKGNAAPETGFEAKVSELMSKQAVAFGGGSQPGGGPGQTGGRLAAMLKKTASAMRQSSDTLVKSLKSLGSTQEEYVSMHRGGNNSFTLQRTSPVVGMLSPGSQGGTPKGHSRTPSYSQQQSARKVTFPQLSRISPTPGGQLRPASGPVNLEDVKLPDTFFGDMDDDARSEALDASGYSRSGASSPGSSEGGGRSSRSLASLFRLSGSQSAAPSPRHSPLQQSSGNGKSSSSPSLVNLDVQAGQSSRAELASPPLLIDLSLTEQLQPAAPSPGFGPTGSSHPATPASTPAAASHFTAAAFEPAVGGSPSTGSPGAPPIVRHVSTLKQSSGAFGSGAFGSPLGEQAQRAQYRLSNLQASSPRPLCASPRMRQASQLGTGAQPAESAEALLTAAILGALSSTAPPAAPTGAHAQRGAARSSSSNEWSAFASAGGAAGGASGAAMARSISGDRNQMGAALRSLDSLGTGSPSSAAAAAAPRLAVKEDIFGGLLAATVTSVSADIRRRTSSSQQDGDAAAAASAPVMRAQQQQQQQAGEESWADFASAADASGQQLRQQHQQQQQQGSQLGPSSSWADWSAAPSSLAEPVGGPPQGSTQAEVGWASFAQ